MGLVPRRLIGSMFRGLGYNIERIKSRDDSDLYAEFSDVSLKNRAFLNIGAGNFNHKFWTNVDYGSEQYAKVQNKFIELNLMEKPNFPFEENSIEVIYSSHTIEHIDDDSVENMIKESFRILKSGGILRISCPDANLLLNSVKNKVKTFWTWRHEWFTRNFNIKPDEIELEDFLVREISTARCRFFENAINPLHPEQIRENMKKLENEAFLNWMVELNEFDQKMPQYHINYWTYEKLKNLCVKAGFVDVYRSGFGQSLSAPLTNTKLFDNTHPIMSLYLEAKKA